MDPVTRTSCPHCGRPRTPAAVRSLSWSSHHTPDGVRWTCAACTRARLAEIECGLPLEPVDLVTTA